MNYKFKDIMFEIFVILNAIGFILGFAGIMKAGESKVTGTVMAVIAVLAGIPGFFFLLIALAFSFGGPY